MSIVAIVVLLVFGHATANEIIPRLNVKMDLTSVVFLLKICNYTQQSSNDEFASFWYGAFSQKLGECSFNNIGFHPNNNRIVEIHIPCIFKSVIGGYTVNNSLLNNTNYNYYNFEYAAYVVKYVNLNMSSYRHRLLVYPRGTPASFYGLGTLGCYDDGCYSWYNTPRFVANLFLHELGHNFGLDHSKTFSDEYGDDTCIMGKQPNRCYNAPHRYSLGWSEPKATLNLTATTTNFSALYSLRNQQFIKINHNVFVEHVDIAGMPQIEQSIHVYILMPNLSTIHLCSMASLGAACTMNGEQSLTFKVINMTTSTIRFAVCQSKCDYAVDIPANSTQITIPNTTHNLTRNSNATHRNNSFQHKTHTILVLLMIALVICAL